MGLKQDARGCQNDEEYVDCTTRNYIESIRQQCGCLPLSIRKMPSNVQCNEYQSKYKTNEIFRIQFVLQMKKWIVGQRLIFTMKHSV